MAVLDESNVVTLITGPNRGIGHELLSAILAQPSQTVIAGVRNPSAAASIALQSLPQGTGSKLILVKMDLESDSDPKEAARQLSELHGIRRLDVVIANAGVAKHYGLVATAPLMEIRDHFSLNTVSVLALFQATLPLLRNAENPKFVACSSDLGSLALVGQKPIPCLAYGVSKVALNFLIRKIHYENEWLTAVALSPGWVQTDMGQYAAAAIGVEKAPVSLAESSQGLLEVIKNASRKCHSGTFQQFDGTVVPW